MIFPTACRKTASPLKHCNPSYNASKFWGGVYFLSHYRGPAPALEHRQIRANLPVKGGSLPFFSVPPPVAAIGRAKFAWMDMARDGAVTENVSDLNGDGSVDQFFFRNVSHFRLAAPDSAGLRDAAWRRLETTASVTR